MFFLNLILALHCGLKTIGKCFLSTNGVKSDQTTKLKLVPWDESAEENETFLLFFLF